MLLLVQALVLECITLVQECITEALPTVEFIAGLMPTVEFIAEPTCVPEWLWALASPQWEQLLRHALTITITVTLPPIMVIRATISSSNPMGTSSNPIMGTSSNPIMGMATGNGGSSDRAIRIIGEAP